MQHEMKDTSPTSDDPEFSRYQYDKYIQYFHFACGHPYRDDGIDIRGKQLFSSGTVDPFTIYVLTPRWCSDCLAERENAIRACYHGRLPETEMVLVDTDKQAFAKGVRDGRIRALSLSFEDCGAGEGREIAETPELNNMVQELMEMGVSNKQPISSQKIDDDLTTKLDQMMLLDEADEELRYSIYWHLAYDEGFEKGRQLQGQKEYEALTNLDPRRAEMLRQALRLE